MTRRWWKRPPKDVCRRASCTNALPQGCAPQTIYCSQGCYKAAMSERRRNRTAQHDKPQRRYTPRVRHDLPFVMANASIEERSAYMRLYTAYQRDDPYWPREAFGEEMTRLLERRHAEPVPRGYRITDAGIDVWRQWIQRQSFPARKTYTPNTAHLCTLLSKLAAGAWASCDSLHGNGMTRFAVAECRRYGLQQGWLVMERRYRVYYVRLTTEGQAALTQMQEGG